MKTALITGAASGIGAGLARALAREGWQLLLTDIQDEALQALGTELDASGQRVITQRLDVSQEADWREALQQVQTVFGQLDLLLNIAGYLLPGQVQQLESAVISRHLDINLKGVILGTVQASQVMIKQGQGQIVNMGSLASLAGIPGLALYSASKFGVRGFSLAAAQELRPHGVYLTLLLPDAVQTPMLELQKDFPEAALTFSGSRFLTVADLEQVLFKVILPKRPLEVMLPRSRGWLAKISSLWPGLALILGKSLSQRGRRRQQKLR